MSVILKREGRIRLYCKGADTVILKRLGPGQERLVADTQEHLDVSRNSTSTAIRKADYNLLLQRFACDGLRTLVVGTKDLTESEYETWKSAHADAANSIDDREERLDEVYDLIEEGLELLGATAIEDKLQV